jgi:hypothetical protein
MNPAFPKFRRLTIASKRAIERITRHYPPYSDYYFFSLWSFNTKNQVSFSFLYGNLIVKFQEYSGVGYFYSFLGHNRVDDTIVVLLREAKKKHLPQVLKLVPESNFARPPASIRNTPYLIEEDEDNFDYIFSVEKLTRLNGKKLHQKKKQIKKFMRSYAQTTTFYSLRNVNVHAELLSVLRKWYTQACEASKNDVEFAAIRRAMRGSRHFNLKAMCVYIDGQLRGFTIFEQVSEAYAVCSFQKADRSYDGIFEFLNQSVAVYLHARGVRYMNMEQDLGVAGLRQAKRKYDPTYLKKYIIKPNTRSV